MSPTKNKLTTFTYILFSICLFSCEKQNERISGKQYFDLESILLQQEKMLVKLNNPLNKITVMNGISDQKTILKVNWKKEFSVFDKINLNKPAYRGGFRIVSAKKEGILKVIYKKKKDTKTDIEFVTTGFTQTNKLLYVRSKVVTKNIVFASVRNYELDFDTTQTELALTAYRVKGNQKFILGNLNIYSAEGIIK